MSTSSQMNYLTQDQVDQFSREGFVAIPGFVDAEDVQDMLARTKTLLREWDPATDPPVPWMKLGTECSEGNQPTPEELEANLRIADGIHYSLEMGALKPDGTLDRPKEEAVRKIGHALPTLDPTFRRVTLQNERVKSVVRDLGLHKDPAVLSGQLILKPPKVGSDFPEHQDSTYWYTEPQSALVFWIALEDCTVENGALAFLPGSHLTHPVHRRFVHLKGLGTGFEKIADPVPTRPEDYVLQPCKAGTLLLFSGNLMHTSSANLSAVSRYIYLFTVIDTAPAVVYDEKNLLQPKEMPKLLEVHA